MKHTSLEIGDAVYPSGRRRDDSDIRKGGKPWGIVVGISAKRHIYTVMWNHGRSYSKHMRQTLVKKDDLESYPRFSRWYDGKVCRNTMTNAWYSNRISIFDDFSTPMQRRPGIYDEVPLGLPVEDFFGKINNINRLEMMKNIRSHPTPVLGPVKLSTCVGAVLKKYFPRPEPKKERKDFSNPFKEHRAQLDSFLSKHSRRKR